MHTLLSRLSPLFVATLLFSCTSGERSADSNASLASFGPNQPQAGASLAVTGDLKVPAGSYLCDAPPAQGGRELGVLQIEGRSNLVLDLSGVDLRGSPREQDLDQMRGVGILVRDSQDVTIRGGTLGGYKLCILIENCQRVTLEDVQFDGWFGQRLLSTPFAENQDDWLWPHDNDQGQWNEKYGAAISVNDCKNIIVRRSRGRHGQNGILLTRTSAAEVYDNDFSFLSGWGIALYRSSHNVISHNIFDYCIRGYSHRVYSRGQDSAGILLFERCSSNIVARNSATHGGDGVFLFAGRDSVDGLAYQRGETNVEGSDDNVFFENDLRFSAANSLEATFSSGNLVLGNDLSGSVQHGVWGGYSRRMVILGNKIDDTADAGITIEHGQDCLIANNSFRNNYKALELYWDLNENDKSFVEGPFGAHNPTSSSGHWIVENTFIDNDQDLVISDSTGLSFQGNLFAGRNELLDIAGGIREDGEESTAAEVVRTWFAGRDGKLPSGRIARSSFVRPSGALPLELEDARKYKLPQIPGSQRTSALERGELGGLQTIVMGAFGPWDFRSGEPHPPQVRAGGVLAQARWDARWFRWSREQSDPRANLPAWRALANAPLQQASVDNFLDPYGSLSEVHDLLANGPFGLIASTRVTIERAGRYRLSVVSDDGVRVRIDGQTALENWTWHGAMTDTAEVELKQGTHTLELEYFQIDGAVALSIELERVGG